MARAKDRAAVAYTSGSDTAAPGGKVAAEEAGASTAGEFTCVSSNGTRVGGRIESSSLSSSSFTEDSHTPSVSMLCTKAPWNVKPSGSESTEASS